MTLTLIHTVPMVIAPINLMVGKELPEMTVYNLFDEYILQLFSKSESLVKERFRVLTALAGVADFTAVTCSSLSRIANEISPHIIPVDEFMFQETKKYSCILLAATAQTTIEPSLSGILRHNPSANVQPLYISKAIDFYKKGDQSVHDVMVLDTLKKEAGKGYDCIVLAQASLAHLQEEAQKVVGIPVLANIMLMIQQIKKEARNAYF